MKGRQENNIKNENKAVEIAAAYPILTNYYYSIGDSMTPMSKKIYCQYIKKFLDFLQSRNIKTDIDGMKTITPDVINLFMNASKYSDKGKELSISYRNTMLAAVNNFFLYLVDSNYINVNPCNKVKKVKGSLEKEVVFLEDGMIDKVKTAIEQEDSNYVSPAMRCRNKLLFTLGVRTGLRETSISEINLEDIDFEEKKITVTEKGNKTREIYIGDNTIAAIKEWLPYRAKILNGTECDALFVSTRRKKRLAVNTITDIVKKYSSMAGQAITPHKMRSTCAVNLYNKTGDIYLTALQLGHKNISNTRRYAIATAERRRNAANILDNI